MALIKGDKHPIGNHVDAALKSFLNHEITVEKGETIYIFTDGFADQFGGEKGKKFNYKRFRTLLLENADLPLDEQQNILKATFFNWKGTLDQVDDVLVIGVKI